MQCPKFPGVPLYFSTQVHLDDSASLQVTACYLHTSNPKLCPFNPGFESAGRFVHQIDLKLIQRRTALHQLGIPRGPIYQTKFVKNMIWDEAQDRVSIYELSGDNTRWVERTGGVDSLKLPGIKRKRSSVTDTGNVSSASLGHAGPSGTSGALAATRAPAGSRSSPRMESDASSIHPNVDNTMDPVSSPQSHDDDHEPVTKRAKLLREVKKETTDNLPASIADHVTPPPQTIDSMSSPHPQHDDHEPVTKRAKKHSEAKETTDNLPASIVDHVTPPPRQYIVLERIYPDSVPAPSAEAPPPGQSTSARTDVKGKMRAVERSSASLSSSTKPNAMSSRDTEIKYGDRSGYSGRWGKGEHPNTPTDFQVKGMLDKYHRRGQSLSLASAAHYHAEIP